MPRSEPLGRSPDRGPGPSGQPPTVRSIHATLRQDIVTLRARPGEKLSENELAMRFGTSRAPVREALIRLVEEELIEVLPQRGSFVSRISLGAVKRARFVREALEVATVRRAAEIGLPPEAVAGAQGAITAQLAAADDPERFTEADDGFHRSFSQGIGLGQVWGVVEREKAQFDRIRFLSLPGVTPVDVLIAQHREILDAVVSRDAARAESAMRLHMAEVLKVADRLAADHPELIVAD
jgi:GntR family transcriptional regulator, rspAB operon transcriptional repressor